MSLVYAGGVLSKPGVDRCSLKLYTLVYIICPGGSHLVHMILPVGGRNEHLKRVFGLLGVMLPVGGRTNPYSGVYIRSTQGWFCKVGVLHLMVPVGGEQRTNIYSEVTGCFVRGGFVKSQVGVYLAGHQMLPLGGGGVLMSILRVYIEVHAGVVL